MIPIRDTAAPRRFTAATSSIMLVCVAVFIQEIRIGGPLLELYAASPDQIRLYLSKGIGNIVTIHRDILLSGFMHGGFLHLFANMLYLFVFGPAVEKALGVIKFIFFYLFAVLASFYTHAVIHPASTAPLVGASGAIAAIMGAYIIYHPRAKIITAIPLLFVIEIIEIPAVIFMFGWFILQWINGIISLGTTSGVAWFAHIGGFIMGMAVGIHLRWLT